jgi:hypothetical protein
VAGDEDRERVRREGASGGAEGGGAPGAARHLAVRERAPVRDPRRGAEDQEPEAAREPPVERQLEAPPAAEEVLVELALRARERVPRGVQHPRRDPLGELVEDGVLALGGKTHAHEPLRRRAEQDRAERRVAALEGDLHEPLGAGARGELPAQPIEGRRVGLRGLAESPLQVLRVLGAFAHVPGTVRSALS